MKTTNGLLALPIKVVNTEVKKRLVDFDESFRYTAKGIVYKDKVYNFRTARIRKGSILALQENEIKNLIHINQITEDKDIFLCVVFRNMYECFILKKNFFKKVSKLMTIQHNSDEYKQLHISYKQLKELVTPTEVFA